MFSWSEVKHQPVIVAHRGASALAPENTLAAFRQAINDGADALEFDVRLTKDGEVVVIHDGKLEGTTNGSGFVSEKTLSELQTLSAGAWFHKKFSVERIPTLDEVFNEVRGKVGINVEMKADADRQSEFDLADRCCQIIKEHYAENIVLLSSFQHHLIKRTRELNSNIATGLLFHPFQLISRSPVRIAQRMGAEFIILSSVSLRKRIVRKAHEQELQVGEYTINTPARINRARRYAVDVIFTDNPAWAKRILSSP